MYCERPKWKDRVLATASRISGQPILYLRPTTPVFGNLMEDKYRLAILGFRALGPEGAPAVPALTPLMVSTNQKLSSAAIVALTCIGQKGLPAFLSALTNASAHNRNLAAANIGCLVNQGFNLTSAVPALVNALDDPDRWVPVNAASSLGAIHLCPDISVPALKNALKHPNSIVRLKAAEALAKFPDQRETGMSALQLMTQGTDDSVQFQAYMALHALTNAPSP
jgi:HEAT repeat protein